MSNCPKCGREIGSTAGPCTQCTFEEKSNTKKTLQELNKKGCPDCRSLRINQVNADSFYCMDCNKIIK